MRKGVDQPETLLVGCKGMWVQSVTVKEWKGKSSKQEISKTRRRKEKKRMTHKVS